MLNYMREAPKGWGKHVTLAYGCLVMLCAGTPYMFGAFNSKLHFQFGLTQTQVLLVETRCDSLPFIGTLFLLQSHPKTLALTM